MPICKLCKEDKPLLKKSHIIPNFMYKDLYDDKHFLISATNEDIKDPSSKTGRISDGYYEGGILCGGCDNSLFGKYESYASRVLFNRRGEKKGMPSAKPMVAKNGVRYSQIGNIDYKKFKLFMLSILWRASITSISFFNRVQLGERHEERLRVMLLGENPGDESDYPFLMYSCVGDAKASKDVIGEPRTLKDNGLRVVVFLINGIFYQFPITSHANLDKFLSCTIKESNEMKLQHARNGEGWDLIMTFMGVKQN